ncbi:hypothetical protein DSECCO2_618530 [anaerobic digester metagenome]
MLGVVKLVPVPSKFPPVAASYHFRVLAPEALSVTVPVPQREAPVAVAAVGNVMVI